ncbi:hypothetical protein QPK31_22960 [Massilia sp. YIM B02769]|uniref:hypothetical protein n=1 Tax=Massilia sp. YIM B02769 TaxID=3050129 RepID=UPI0025B6AEC7|nr:hypothetical protein [Massilia sp. YIM B02769]MDN4061083.1 hypothetical protein [Massilia sp. YIM B02769]
MRNYLKAVPHFMLAAFLLGGCYGNTSMPEEAAIASLPVVGVQPGAVGPTELPSVSPAHIVKLDLSELGFPDGVDSINFQGPIADYLIKSGKLIFATPVDSGVNEKIAIEIKKGDKQKALVMYIDSRRLREPVLNEWGDAEGNKTSSQPKLITSGFGPDNSLNGAPLTFRIEGVPAYEFGKESDGLIYGDSVGRVAALKKYWTYDHATNSFTISQAKMNDLMAILPSGLLTIEINLVASDADFAANFDLAVVSKGAILHGNVINGDGTRALDLVGRKILLSGKDFATDKVAMIDSSAAFVFENIVPGSYEIELQDLSNPKQISMQFEIGKGATRADVTLVNESSSDAGNDEDNDDSLTQKTKARGQFSQNGKIAYDSKQAQAGYLNREMPVTPTDFYIAAFEATSAGAGALVSKDIVYTVPQYMTSVRVVTWVATSEWPYDSESSNASWSYIVKGLPGGDIRDEGLIFATHVDDGILRTERCIDVRSLTKDGALKISGKVTAMTMGELQKNHGIARRIIGSL